MKISGDTVLVLVLMGIVIGSLLIYLSIQPASAYLFTPNQCPPFWYET